MRKWDEIGGVLARARNRASLSVASAADQAGITRSTLSNLEAGRRRCGVEVLGRLARVLSLTRDEQARILELAGAPLQEGQRGEGASHG